MSTRTHLNDIPKLADEAWQTWGTNAATTDGARTRRRADTGIVLADLDRMLIANRVPAQPIPARVWHYPGVTPAERAQAQALDAALQQRHVSVGTLFGWVQVHHGDETLDGRDTWLPHDDVASVCTWLATRLDWAQEQDWWTEYADDVKLLWAELRAVCRIRDAKLWTCFTANCGQRMDLMGDVFRCTEGHEHPGPERLAAKWGRHPSMPTDAIVELGWASSDQLRQWKARGQIKADASKGNRPTWWWPWDVLCLREPALLEAFPDAAKREHGAA